MSIILIGSVCVAKPQSIKSPGCLILLWIDPLFGRWLSAVAASSPWGLLILHHLDPGLIPRLRLGVSTTVTLSLWEVPVYSVGFNSSWACAICLIFALFHHALHISHSTHIHFLRLCASICTMSSSKSSIVSFTLFKCFVLLVWGIFHGGSSVDGNSFLFLVLLAFL